MQCEALLRKQREKVEKTNISIALSNLYVLFGTKLLFIFSKSSNRATEEDETGRTNKELAITRRRGKRLRKGKYRRGSAYRQQTEVHDLLEPTETQISHIGDGSRRTSLVKRFYIFVVPESFCRVKRALLKKYFYKF